MGLQYTTPTGWTNEVVTATEWTNEVITDTSWYDESLWKEFTFGTGADEEYRDDIDEISPSEA